MPLTAALGLAGSPGHVQGQESFSGRVALGYLATSGNTETHNVNADFDLQWNYGSWVHAFSSHAITASTSGVTSAEAYGIEWQSNRSINGTRHLFGQVALDTDSFSSYSRQTRASFGYGWQFIERETHNLNGEAGIGTRRADLSDGKPEGNSILHLAGDYRWGISETSEFTQTLVVESGSNNTYLEAESSLSASVLDDFSLVLSYTIQHNSEVVPGKQNTDSFTAVYLEYTF